MLFEIPDGAVTLAPVDPLIVNKPLDFRSGVSLGHTPQADKRSWFHSLRLEDVNELWRIKATSELEFACGLSALL